VQENTVLVEIVSRKKAQKILTAENADNAENF
jgi:hypothetical protein